jgi:hypothetical protein
VILHLGDLAFHDLGRDVRCQLLLGHAERVGQQFHVDRIRDLLAVDVVRDPVAMLGDLVAGLGIDGVAERGHREVGLPPSLLGHQMEELLGEVLLAK